MKTLEFDAQISRDSTLQAPTAFSSQIEAGQPVHVVLVMSESGEDQEWSQLSAEQFLKSYADSDAIYDALPAASVEENKFVPAQQSLRVVFPSVATRACLTTVEEAQR